MRDDFLTIASQVHATSTLDMELCKIAVRDSFRELLEYTNWSWLLKRGVITLPTPYNTGLASFTQYSQTVTGSAGAVFDSSMIGRQVRAAVGDPFYTIIDVPSSTTLTISPAWADTSSASPTAYSIFSAYITPPDDFFSWVSVKVPANGWRLNLNMDQSMLDGWDPKRASTGTPRLLSPVDYAPSYSGKVYPVVQVLGTGPAPISSGTYLGPAEALFTIQITTGGAADVAVFQWKKDGGAWQTGYLAASAGVLLPEGIGLTWSPAATYILNDTFCIRTSAVASPGLPRFEIYPYPSSQMIVHFQYLSRYPDLDDPNVVLPRFIPGNVVKEGALAKAGRIPGTEDRPNPYAQRARAENHETRFDMKIVELMRQDQEVFCTSIQYDFDLPYAPLPWGAGFSGRSIDYDPISIYPI